MDTVNALTTRQRQLLLTLILGLIALLVGAAACGTATPTTGALEIVVTGLPSGTAADITVDTHHATGPTSLTLAPGAYTLHANPVVASASIMGDRLAPDHTHIDVTITAGQTTTVTITYAVTQQALLLAPNYGDGTVTVLTVADLVDGGMASRAWRTDDGGNSYSGMTFGPDGRLYVVDYANNTIVIVAGADLASDGDVTPAAVISIDGHEDPVGAAFDSDGNLWVGTYFAGVLLRFDDVLAITDDALRAPALVLAVDDSTFARGFGSIQNVFVDHLDNVWAADYVSNAIYRFDGITGLTGAQTRVPDLFLEPAVSDVSASGYTLNDPISLVVDVEGTLYVGNYDYEVSRFGHALSLSGYQDLEASAYLYTGTRYIYMIALDQSGALWVGHWTGELVRITDPGGYEGLADVSDEFDLELWWLTASGKGYLDGGTLTFVPTQGRHAGY